MGIQNENFFFNDFTSLKVSGISRSSQLLTLSAKTAPILEKVTQNLVEYLKNHPNLSLADIAYTLQVNQKAYNHRRMLVCYNHEDAIQALEAIDPKRVFTTTLNSNTGPIAFMLPGGSTLPDENIGQQLYQTEAVFREQIDICAQILQPHLNSDIRDLFCPVQEQPEAIAIQLQKTPITIPIIFVVEYALAKLWMSWGIKPQIMMGYSLGEYVAACLAGVISLRDILSIVALGGKLLETLPKIPLLGVFLSEEKLQPFLGDKLSLMVISGTSFCVIGGSPDVMVDLKLQLQEKEVKFQRLSVGIPAHSWLVDLILEEYTDFAKKIHLYPPAIPYISCASGTWITSEEATNPAYWGKVMRQTIRGTDAVAKLLKATNPVIVEVGPGRMLSTLVRQYKAKAKKCIVLTSLRASKNQQSDVDFLLNSLGHLWLAGAEIDWARFYASDSNDDESLATIQPQPQNQQCD